MKKDIQKHKKNLLALALTMSVLFVCGLVLLIISIVDSFAVMLVAGIIVTVAGTYGMSFYLIFLSKAVFDEKLIYAVEQEKIFDVESLSRKLGSSEKKTKSAVRYILKNGYLSGFSFPEQKVLVKDNQKTDIETAETKCGLTKNVVCPFCGAKVLFYGSNGICPYCGNDLNGKKDTDENDTTEKTEN